MHGLRLCDGQRVCAQRRRVRVRIELDGGAQKLAEQQLRERDVEAV
jgi:hypothetical protein